MLYKIVYTPVLLSSIGMPIEQECTNVIYIEAPDMSTAKVKFHEGNSGVIERVKLYKKEINMLYKIVYTPVLYSSIDAMEGIAQDYTNTTNIEAESLTEAREFFHLGNTGIIVSIKLHSMFQEYDKI